MVPKDCKSSRYSALVCWIQFISSQPDRVEYNKIQNRNLINIFFTCLKFCRIKTNVFLKLFSWLKIWSILHWKSWLVSIFINCGTQVLKHVSVPPPTIPTPKKISMLCDTNSTISSCTLFLILFIRHANSGYSLPKQDLFSGPSGDSLLEFGNSALDHSATTAGRKHVLLDVQIKPRSFFHNAYFF